MKEMKEFSKYELTTLGYVELRQENTRVADAKTRSVVIHVPGSW